MADNFAEISRLAERFVRDALPGLLRSTQHPEKEDFAQEAFSRFFTTEDWPSIRNPKAYLGQIFRHVIWERRRADARNSAFITTDSDQLERAVETCSAPAAAGPEGKLSVSQEIDAALSGLPKTRRDVYILKALGHSYSEIEAEMSLACHTVKKYVCKAQQHCRGLAKDAT